MHFATDVGCNRFDLQINTINRSIRQEAEQFDSMIMVTVCVPMRLTSLLVLCFSFRVTSCRLSDWILQEIIEESNMKIDTVYQVGVDIAAAVKSRYMLFWLILPVVTCLSQRLSHACLSTHCRTVKPRMAH